MSTIFRVSRFPPGKRFAVTFVDDTDLSTRANTEPVYRLLKTLGLYGTKTVWPLRARRTSAFRVEKERPAGGVPTGDTLEDGEYVDFALGLQAAGFDIGLHGVSAGNSCRDEISRGLARFRSIFGRDPAINSFHQTNIENLYAGYHKLDSFLLRVIERLVDRSDYQGHVEGSQYFWGDIASSTFRYVRTPFHTISAADTLRVCPRMPFHDERRPHVRRWFICSDGADVRRFARLLSDDNVRRLDRQGGACLVYTHFAKGFWQPGPRGGHLADMFVRVVERLASRAGGWFPTAVELLDRLAITQNVNVVHDGLRVSVHNRGEVAASSLSLMAAAGVELHDETGCPLPRRAEGEWVLPALQAGETARYLTNRSGSSTLGGESEPPITLREHRRVEYHNYLGLIRGVFMDRYEIARGR